MTDTPLSTTKRFDGWGDLATHLIRIQESGCWQKEPGSRGKSGEPSFDAWIDAQLGWLGCAKSAAYRAIRAARFFLAAQTEYGFLAGLPLERAHERLPLSVADALGRIESVATREIFANLLWETEHGGAAASRAALRAIWARFAPALTSGSVRKGKGNGRKTLTHTRATMAALNCSIAAIGAASSFGQLGFGSCNFGFDPLRACGTDLGVDMVLLVNEPGGVRSHGIAVNRLPRDNGFLDRTWSIWTEAAPTVTEPGTGHARLVIAAASGYRLELLQAPAAVPRRHDISDLLMTAIAAPLQTSAVWRPEAARRRRSGVVRQDTESPPGSGARRRASA